MQMPAPYRFDAESRMLRFFKSQGKSSPRRAVPGPRCQQCRAALPAGSARCLKCGNRTKPGARGRVLSAANRLEPQLPLVTAPRAARNPTPSPELSEIQREILIAAQQGSVGMKSIYVMGTKKGDADGEVKSGNQRFFGNEAVAAVVALLGPGLIEPIAEDAFELTETGLHSAVNLVMARQFDRAV